MASPPATASIPAAELGAALDRLQALLEDSDSEAADLLDELLERVAAMPLARALKPVAEAIGGYDFDTALAALAQARGG